MTTPRDQLNDALFVDVLARIERSPQHWNQGSWLEFQKVNGTAQEEICTTAGCFAGWACLIAGKGLPLVTKWAMDNLQDGHEDAGSSWRTPDGEILSVEEYAQQLLGLTEEVLDNLDEEANSAAIDLFSGSNDKGVLYEHVAAILGITEETLHEKVRARMATLAELDPHLLPKPTVPTY